MITIDNYELYFFQYQEGMLDPETRREVESFAQLHPSLSEELSLYAQAPFIEPEEIPYPDKDKLKHKIVPLYYWRFAVASVVLLATSVFIYFFSPHFVPQSSRVIAENNSIQSHSISAKTLCANESTSITGLSIASNQLRAKEARPANDVIADSRIEESVADSISVAESHQELPEVMPSSIDQESLCIAENELLEYLSEPDSLIIVDSVTTIFHDYSDVTLADFIIDKAIERYPLEVSKIALFACRLVNLSNRIINNRFVSIVLSNI